MGVGMNNMKLILICAVLILLVRATTAEVVCSQNKDLGGGRHQLIMGPCYWKDGGKLVNISDVSSFTWDGRSFNFDGKNMGGETVKITPVLVSTSKTEYLLDDLRSAQKLSYSTSIKNSGGWKYGVKLDFTNVSSVVKSNIDYLTWKIEGKLPDGVTLDFSDLEAGNHTLDSKTPGEVKTFNLTKNIDDLDPTLTLTSAKVLGDSDVYEADPGTNYGTSSQMILNIAFATVDRFGIMSLNISSITAGSLVDNVIFEYNLTSNLLDAGEAYNVSFYALNYSSAYTWTETNITWNTRPTGNDINSPTCGGFIQTTGDANGLYNSSNLSACFNYAMVNNKTTLDLYLIPYAFSGTPGNDPISINSKDTIIASAKYKFYIDYTEGTTTTTTTVTTTTTTAAPTTTSTSTSTTGTTTTSTGTTTTLTPAFNELYHSNVLLAIWVFWTGLLPAPYNFLPILLFMGLVWTMMALKMGVVIPSILLVIFLAAFNFLIMPLGGWIFYGVMVFLILLTLYKVLT